MYFFPMLTHHDLIEMGLVPACHMGGTAKAFTPVISTP
jgi:hypothetical protein